MSGDTAELTEGTLLRTSNPPAEPIRDVNGDLLPPAEAFIFKQLTNPEDCRGFHLHWAVSTDWEQHASCNGTDGALERCGADGRSHTYVWRLSIPRVRNTLHLGPESTITLLTFHWPERANEAHSHILYDCNGSANKAKRVARKFLQLEAGVTLAAPES